MDKQEQQIQNLRAEVKSVRVHLDLIEQTVEKLSGAVIEWSKAFQLAIAKLGELESSIAVLKLDKEVAGHEQEIET